MIIRPFQLFSQSLVLLQAFRVTAFSLRGYKTKTSLKLRCSGCRFVRKKGVLRVLCSKKPRHKQRQG